MNSYFKLRVLLTQPLETGFLQTKCNPHSANFTFLPCDAAAVTGSPYQISTTEQIPHYVSYTCTVELSKNPFLDILNDYLGVFHSVFNACGPLTRDQEIEGYFPPGILLGSNLLQFNCTMVCRGKGVLTRTFLAISEGFCPPSDNISQTAGITRQLLSIYCLQQDKKNVATDSQM